MIATDKQLQQAERRGSSKVYHINIARAKKINRRRSKRITE